MVNKMGEVRNTNQEHHADYVLHSIMDTVSLDQSVSSIIVVGSVANLAMEPIIAGRHKLC